MTAKMILHDKVSNGVMRSRLLARGNFDDKGEKAVSFKSLHKSYLIRSRSWSQYKNALSGEAVEARIKSFNEQTKPVLAAYSQIIDVVSDCFCQPVLHKFIPSEVPILLTSPVKNILR